MSRRLTPLLVVGLSATLLAGCGGSSDVGAPSSAPSSSVPDASATAPADPTAATAEIKTNWAAFFNGQSSDPNRLNLLQDHEALAEAIAFNFDAAAAKLIGSRVTSVTFTGATTADVLYDVLQSGNPLLTGAKGKAVEVAGVWQVSRETFCALKVLGAAGKPVPGCS